MFNATLTTASPTSVEFTPSDSVSLYTVEGTFTGNVELQYRNPASTAGWFTAVSCTARDSSPVMTPSTDYLYRFRLLGLSTGVVVSFGPTA